jgi:hypothetical protein
MSSCAECTAVLMSDGQPMCDLVAEGDKHVDHCDDWCSWMSCKWEHCSGCSYCTSYCASWCNEYNCDLPQCTGCEAGCKDSD